MTSPLHEKRLDAVVAVLRARSARTVLDLGCGDGDLLLRLAQERGVERVVGIDRSPQALERLRMRLRCLHGECHERVRLVHGSMMEPHPSLGEYDAVVLLESIEHVEPALLSKVERAVFAWLRPLAVLITTPNADYNPVLRLPEGRFRHSDHRFEWGRAKFRAWAEGVAARHDYQVCCSDLGRPHALYGGPSQMAVFERPG